MAASPRLTKAEYQTLAAFRYHLRRFLRFSEAAAQSAGLTPRQYQALLASSSRSFIMPPSNWSIAFPLRI
jgi:hypothetical protein